jgi:prevent-host-death family protein
MKTAVLRDVKQKLSDYVTQAQKDKIVITKHGRPSAILWGVEGKDFEDIVYLTSPGFWRMISKRRQSKAIPWKEAKKKLKAF